MKTEHNDERSPAVPADPDGILETPSCALCGKDERLLKARYPLGSKLGRYSISGGSVF